MNPDQPPQPSPRAPPHTRLQLLSPPRSPRSSIEVKQDDCQTKEEMKLPVTTMASPARANIVSPTFMNAAINRSSSNSPQPVVRWISSWSSTPRRSPTCSRDHSPPRNRPPSAPSTPIASLSGALSEPIPNLPRKPPNARLPSQFYASRSLSRRPAPLLDLTRATFPTTSLSSSIDFDSESSSHTSSRPDFLHSSPPVILSHPPKSGSSIDKLRSVHNRTLSTTAPPQSAPIPRFAFWWGKGDNVDPLLNEADRAETAQEREEVRKKYCAPRNPLVFCHGLLGFDSVTIGPAIAPLEVTHWRGIKEVLTANGIEVLITRVPATSSPRDRARVLLENIEKVYGGRSVHLIGHSMGGLDCRYLTTHLTDRSFNVLSVTTIATPHRGSPFASHFLDTIGGPSRLPSVLTLLDLLPNGGGDGKAFEFLTVENMHKFNEETPDTPGVKYYSWGASYEPGLIDTWKWPHSVIQEKEGPNDGLVSVSSSQWGTYLGTLHQVNHLDLVGWVNPARYKWAEMWGNEISFRPATFYLGVADLLARQVEKIKGDHENFETEASDELSQAEELQPTLGSHPDASTLAKAEKITRKARGENPEQDGLGIDDRTR